MFSHSVAVACVAVHTDPLTLWDLVFVAVLRSAEIRVSGFELAVEADDSHGVGGVAVVAADGPVSALTHAVAYFGKVQLVQQVLVETGVFVDSVVLTIAVAGDMGGASVELNMDRFVSWSRETKKKKKKIVFLIKAYNKLHCNTFSFISVL